MRVPCDLVHTPPAKFIPHAQDQIVSRRFNVEGGVKGAILGVVVAPKHPVVAGIDGEGRECEALGFASSVGEVESSHVERNVSRVHDFHPVSVPTGLVSHKGAVQRHHFIQAERVVGGAADPSLCGDTGVCGLCAVAVRRGRVPADLVGIGQIDFQSVPAILGSAVSAQPVVIHGKGLVGGAVYAEVKLHGQRRSCGLGLDAKGVVHHRGVSPGLNVSRELGVGRLAVCGRRPLVHVGGDALWHMAAPSRGEAVQEGVVVEAVVEGAVDVLQGRCGQHRLQRIAVLQPSRP